MARHSTFKNTVERETYQRFFSSIRSRTSPDSAVAGTLLETGSPARPWIFESPGSASDFAPPLDGSEFDPFIFHPGNASVAARSEGWIGSWMTGTTASQS